MSPCATTAGRRLIAPWLERSRDHKIRTALPFGTNIATTPPRGMKHHILPATNSTMIGPSQSSAPVYGHSLTLNGVTKLSTTKYAESPLAQFTPDAVNCGRCKTYNWISGVELSDGRKTTPLTMV